MAVSLAEQVRQIFQGLSNRARESKEHQQKSLLVCWRQNLFDSPDDDTRFYEAIGLVYSAVLRLSQQVQASKNLDKQAKNEASRIISGLHECTLAERMHIPAHAVLANLAEDRLGALGILASALRREYPSPELPRDEIAQLVEAAKSLQKTISSAQIDGNLRAVLLHQISVLIWTLEHTNFVGFEAVRDSVARVALASTELHDDSTEKAAQTGAAPNLRARISNLCRQIMRGFKLAKDVGDGVSSIRELGEDVLQIASEIADDLS